MSDDIEILTAVEIVVASQFPTTVPLIHQAAIVYELLCQAATESTFNTRLMMLRTLIHLSSLSGMTLPQVAFAWLAHQDGIEGFMEDHSITYDDLTDGDARLSETLHVLQHSINAINEEAIGFQQLISDIYRVSD